MGDIFKIKEFGYAQRGLDMLSARQTTTAANIANAETPGYKAVNVEFERQFADAIGKGFAMAETSPKHMPTGMKGAYGVKPEVVYKTADGRLDENTVNMDEEMSRMTQTEVSYDLLTSIYNKSMNDVFSSLEDAKQSK